MGVMPKQEKGKITTIIESGGEGPPRSVVPN